VVALDPGVRTFQTCCEVDGPVTEWGKADMDKLFSELSHGGPGSGVHCPDQRPVRKQVRAAQSMASLDPADSEQDG